MLSVIVPVRNEVNNILNLLSDLNKQDYSKDQFEVIVVDDESNDGTSSVVEDFIKTHDGVRLIKQQNDQTYPTPKKRALTTGVQAALGEVIVTTDGDCRVPQQWLSAIAGEFKNDETDFVSGPVVYDQEGSLFERLQSMEFASLIGVGASSIRLGYPNICNGANLAFRRSQFDLNHGYNGNGHIASGDDEFLLQKFAKNGASHIRFLKDNKAIIKTRPKVDLKEFYHQRKRWTSKLKHHKRWHIKALSIFIFSINTLLITSLFSSILGFFDWGWFLVILGLKMTSEAFFLKGIFNFFNKSLRWLEFVLLSLIHPFYIVLFGIFTNFGTFNWKGRTYHE